MKVIAINGSPHPHGNTALCLETVCRELEARGVETETFSVGRKALGGCLGCGGCAKTGRCVQNDEEMDQWCQKIWAADGLVLASPVHYASMGGTMKCFLDRLFYQSQGRLRGKAGASVAVLRRSGGVTTFDDLNHYLLISEMFVVPSFYWNVVHGTAPGEAAEDAEGQALLRTLGANMAWFLQVRQQTADTLPFPQPLPRARTNFIR